jgi:hypothetical protein
MPKRTDVPKEFQLGDAPIEEPYRDIMVRIVQALDHGFNGNTKGTDRKTGFVLMVFPFNEVAPGGSNRCNYASNGANRKDIVALMKQMIARFEGQPEMKGTA